MHTLNSVHSTKKHTVRYVTTYTQNLKCIQFADVKEGRRVRIFPLWEDQIKSIKDSKAETAEDSISAFLTQ